MPIDIIDIASQGSGAVNEDRTGSAGTLAWAIDGATDLVETPLVGEHSDAAWLAEQTQRRLEVLQDNELDDLAELPIGLARHLADAFYEQTRRQPAAQWEHPSAAAMITRTRQGALEWISLGDCALIVETPDGLKSIGVGGPDAGDHGVASTLQRIRKQHAMNSDTQRLTQMLPELRKGRGGNLNQPGGYGVISITPPPADLIGTGTLPVAVGSHALLATDGLMRLVEIFARHDAASLLEAAKTTGLNGLLNELRSLEDADNDCQGHPRVKRSDDATALLIRIR